MGKKNEKANKKNSSESNSRQKFTKKKKGIIGGIFGLLFIALLGVGAWMLGSYFVNKNQEPLSNTKQLVFETTNQSVARAIQFEVGQADCGLVQVSKDNKFETRDDNFNILVDVGIENRSSSAVKKALMDKIYNEFVTNVDLIVLSHLHFDHIGAVDYFLKDKRFNFNNTQVLFNWSEARYFASTSKGLTATAKTMFKTIEEMKLTLNDSSYWANQDNNKIVDFGNGNYFSVLGGLDIAKDKDNQNAWSVINRFQWNNQSILYTGDLAGDLNSQGLAYTIAEKHYNELDCDILKAPHHGSVTEHSNGTQFLNKVSPTEVWISAGHEDKYTLPDVDALNYYLKVLNNDPSKIKATLPFGKSRDQIIIDNPNATPAEIDKYVNDWKPLNDWVKKYPTANNNNKGYNDIKKVFN